MCKIPPKGVKFRQKRKTKTTPKGVKLCKIEQVAKEQQQQDENTKM